MRVKVRAEALEDMSDIYIGETILVDVDLDDIEYDIEKYAEKELDMVKEDEVLYIYFMTLNY